MTHSNLHQLTDALGPAQDIVSKAKLAAKIERESDEICHKTALLPHLLYTSVTYISITCLIYICTYVCTSVSPGVDKASQQGPLICCERMSLSMLEVLVPKAWLKVRPLALAGRARYWACG